MKRQPSSDPCLTAWLAHCASRTRAGDAKHSPHSAGGTASFRSNDAESYCECGVPDCDWTWSAPKEAA